jgi:hypothetical protein
MSHTPSNRFAWYPQPSQGQWRRLSFIRGALRESVRLDPLSDFERRQRARLLEEHDRIMRSLVFWKAEPPPREFRNDYRWVGPRNK